MILHRHKWVITGVNKPGFPWWSTSWYTLTLRTCIVCEKHKTQWLRGEWKLEDLTGNEESTLETERAKLELKKWTGG